ncbi:hypothetical protein DL96DRAFT_1717541 [Flagelloscypha sp. PMI_526]|nr:hypothetical protein DL96DRAFT_1717541 [Flagelloscypha sp. PMI_526]
MSATGDAVSEALPQVRFFYRPLVPHHAVSSTVAVFDVADHVLFKTVRYILLNDLPLAIAFQQRRTFWAGLGTPLGGNQSLLGNWTSDPGSAQARRQDVRVSPQRWWVAYDACLLTNSDLLGTCLCFLIVSSFAHELSADSQQVLSGPASLLLLRLGDYLDRWSTSGASGSGEAAPMWGGGCAPTAPYDGQPLPMALVMTDSLEASYLYLLEEPAMLKLPPPHPRPTPSILYSLDGDLIVAWRISCHDFHDFHIDHLVSISTFIFYMRYSQCSSYLHYL